MPHPNPSPTPFADLARPPYSPIRGSRGVSPEPKSCPHNSMRPFDRLPTQPVAETNRPLELVNFRQGRAAIMLPA